MRNGTMVFRKMPLWSSLVRYLSGNTNGDFTPLWKEASLWVYRHGTKWVVDGFPASTHSIKNLHPCRQGPNTYEAILSDHPQQTWYRWGVVFRGARGLAWHQSSSDSMPPEDTVDSSTSQTHATSNSTLPHALTGKCKHFMSNTYRVW